MATELLKSNVWNAGKNGPMDNEIVIKYCVNCGHTKKMPYSRFVCPACNNVSLAFFKNINHLVKYIDLYGLRNIEIADEDVRKNVIAAFKN